MSENRYKISLDANQAFEVFARLGEVSGDLGDRIAGGLQKSTKGFSAIAQGAATAAAALTGVGVAAVEVTKKLVDMADQGAQISQLREGFKALGGSAAEMAQLRDATAGLVPDAVLMRLRNSAVLSGINAKNLDKLARVASGAAVSMGRDFEESFERIVLGTSKLEREFFDELGIKLRSMTVVYDEFAKNAGVSVKALTEDQKQLAFMNEVLNNSTKQLALGQLAGANQAASLGVQWQNMQDGLMQLVNETLNSAGVFDRLTQAMDIVKQAFAENGDELRMLVDVGMKQVIRLLPTFIDMARSLAPLLELLPPAVTWFNAALSLMVPRVAATVRVLTSLSTTVVGVVLTALQTFLKAAMKVADAVGIELPSGIKRASESITGLRSDIESAKKRAREMEERVKNLGDAALDTAPKLDAMGKAAKKAADMMVFGRKVSVDSFKEEQQAAKDVLSYLDDQNSGFYSLSATIVDSSKNQEQALAKLGDYYDQAEQGLNDLAAAGLISTEQLEMQLYALGTVADNAGIQIEKAFSQKQKRRTGGGGKSAAVKLAEAEGKALVLLMTDRQRQIHDLEEKFIAAQAPLIGKRADLVAQLEQQKHAQLLDLRMSFAREDLTAATEASQALSLAMMSETSRAFEERRQQTRAEFMTLINLAGGLQTEMGQRMNAALMESIGKINAEQAQQIIDSIKQPIMQGWEDAIKGVARMTGQWLTDIEDKNKEKTAAIERMFAKMAQNVGSTLIGLATSANTTREETFKTLGQLFGQLGSAFLAWATAEGNLLAGNPFGAAAAAIALQGIAAAIGSVGKRSSSGGGATSSAAARDFSQPRDEQRGATIIQYNYGFVAPDEVAQGAMRAEQRAQSLRGRS